MNDLQQFKGGGRVNNLNLIRLFAAFQVLVGHLHNTFAMPECIRYISCFNGVPIFFTISGFLIYWSYDNNPNVKTYTRNRFLRIYPALLCAFAVTIVLLLSFGILTFGEMFSSSFVLWVGAQLTFVQEFAPTFIRGFGGSAAPNPVLWTISVEMLLYVMIPVLYTAIQKFNRNNKALIILILGLASYAENQTGIVATFLNGLSGNGYYIIFIHPFLQFASFFWYFCIGIEVYLYRDKVIPLLSGRAIYLLAIYLMLCSGAYYAGYDPGNYSPRSVELLAHLLLVACIFSFAYTKPDFTQKLIGKTDISYGLYIYHDLVLHSFYEMGLIEYVYLIPAIMLSFFVAWLSWTFVEKRALQLKKSSLYKISLSQQ